MSSLADSPGDGEEGDLADQVAQGDRAAAEALVRRYSGRILAVAIARTRDREAARELVDDTLMAVIQALRDGKVRNPARLGAFVYGTAINLINNHLRTRNRRPPLDELRDDIPGPDGRTIAERDCDIALLHRLIAQLDPRDRQVLALSLVDGLEPGDISRRTGLSEDAVRQRKSRALRRLKQILDGPSHGSAPGPHTSR